MRRPAALLATLIACVVLPACPPPDANASGHDRPNVLILLADDLQWDALGALGDDRILTPNLDRLVAEGLTFTHMYNQGSEHGAVCMPSRAMFLTGRHLWRRGGDNVEGMPLMGEAFGDAGYATFVTGKWHNGKQALQRGYQRVGPTGPGMLHSTSQSEDGYHRDGLGSTWLPDDETRKGHWVTGRDGDIVHSSAHWADEAITWMAEREASDDGRPFLAHVAFHAPHDPRQAPTAFLDQYPPDERPLPPNMLREHPFDNGALRLRDEQLASFPRSDEAVRLHMAEYAAIVSHLDQEVGRILDALDSLGMADDTLVLFTADHGLSVGQHGLLGKQSLYDHSTRVSWVLRGPGVPVGRRSDALTYLHSTFPTLAELCAVPAPDSIDTPSLAPLVRGADESPHDTLFAAYARTQRMVRDRQHKLVLYPQVAQMQLFDLTDDPWEMENLAGDPALAPVIARLHGELLAWMDATEDPLDHADVALDRRWTVTSLRPSADALVIEHVTVVDGTGGPARPDVSVVVRDGRVDAVGQDLPHPEGARVIDGTGRWLVPGLWDLHVHPDDPEMWHLEPPEEDRRRFLPLFVAAGVTSVRDMGGDLTRIDGWREDVAAGRVVGPHIVRAGPLVDGPDPMWPGSVAVGDAAAGRAAVDDLVAQGVDFVKVYSLLSADAFAGIAERCRELDVPFSGHVPREVTVLEAASAGMASQEHLLGMLTLTADPARLAGARAAIPGGLGHVARRNAQYDAMVCSADADLTTHMANHLAANGTVVVPTLVLWKRRAWFDAGHPRVAPFLPLMPPHVQRWWDPSENIHLEDFSEESMEGERQLYGRYVELARALHEAGVPLLPGTDTGGNPHLFPGFSVHDELEILVDEVGLTPGEALVAATSASAELCRRPDRGTIAAGQVADLLLLRADPLADITALREIDAVVLAGRLLESADLDALLVP